MNEPEPPPHQNDTPEPSAPGTPDVATLKAWAVEQMPISLSICNLENRLVAGNAETWRLLNAREEETLGLRIKEFYPGAAGEWLERRQDEVIRTGRSQSFETFNRAPGERLRHAWTTSAYPLRDPDGRLVGVAGISVDTTAEYQARQRLTIVNAASARVGTTLEVAQTAQELADVATGRFADFVAVDLIDSVVPRDPPDRGRPVGPPLVWRAGAQSVLEGCPESAIEPGATDRYTGNSPMDRALATGRPTLYKMDDPEVQAWLKGDPARARTVEQFRIHAAIVAPLLARGTTLGMAQFLRHRNLDPFDTDDLLLAEEITARAALAIDNARRYTHERDIALALQRSLLPRQTPRSTTVEIASRYLPAGSQAGVGGDWFDVIQLSGARTALVVGDVVGHGIQASATMGRLRTAVRTLADIDMPPDELLTHLDDLVLRLDREEDPSGDQTVRPEAGETAATCLYAVYDPVSRRCTLARAGHPAPAVVRPDGSAYLPDVPAGPPLGLGGLPFESTEIDLPDGSLIALFTDGLIETVDHDIDTGLTQLTAALTADAATSPLEKHCDDIIDTLLPTTPTDDVALLLAHTNGLDAAHVATWDLPADPAVVAQARKAATDQLTSWGLEDLSFVTELVVSELITNAIRHAHPPIRLRLIHHTSLICEVSDASSTAPHLRRARAFDEGGRGLMLVAQLATRWGTRHTPQGKTIWTEQALTGLDLSNG